MVKFTASLAEQSTKEKLAAYEGLIEALNCQDGLVWYIGAERYYRTANKRSTQ